MVSLEELPDRSHSKQRSFEEEQQWGGDNTDVSGIPCSPLNARDGHSCKDQMKGGPAHTAQRKSFFPLYFLVSDAIKKQQTNKKPRNKQALSLCSQKLCGLVFKSSNLIYK